MASERAREVAEQFARQWREDGWPFPIMDRFADALDRYAQEREAAARSAWQETIRQLEVHTLETEWGDDYWPRVRALRDAAAAVAALPPPTPGPSGTTGEPREA